MCGTQRENKEKLLELNITFQGNKYRANYQLANFRFWLITK
jgi:hypothetical protein